MDIQKFAKDSPLGLGWLTGNVPLSVAVAALARQTKTTVQAVKAKYGINTSKEEDPQRST